MPIPVTDESKGNAHKLGQCQNLIAVHVAMLWPRFHKSMNPILMSYPTVIKHGVLENGQ